MGAVELAVVEFVALGSKPGDDAPVAPVNGQHPVVDAVGDEGAQAVALRRRGHEPGEKAMQWVNRSPLPTPREGLALTGGGEVDPRRQLAPPRPLRVVLLHHVGIVSTFRAAEREALVARLARTWPTSPAARPERAQGPAPRAVQCVRRPSIWRFAGCGEDG